MQVYYLRYLWMVPDKATYQTKSNTPNYKASVPVGSIRCTLFDERHSQEQENSVGEKEYSSQMLKTE